MVEGDAEEARWRVHGRVLARVAFSEADDGLVVANSIEVCQSRGATDDASAGVAGVEELPTGPLVARAGAAGAWTGREAVLWGGRTDDADAPFEGRPLDDGGAYDPAARRWRVLPDAPLTPRSGATAVWDGDEVVIAGAGLSRSPMRRPSIR